MQEFPKVVRIRKETAKRLKIASAESGVYMAALVDFAINTALDAPDFIVAVDRYEHTPQGLTHPRGVREYQAQSKDE